MKSKLFEEVLNQSEITPLTSKIKKVSIWDSYNDTNEDCRLLGTPESPILKFIVQNGFNPIGITYMMCEETFIFQTIEECNRAVDVFMPYGWWYSIDDPSDNNWADTVKWYYKEMCKSFDYDTPIVYWLDGIERNYPHE